MQEMQETWVLPLGWKDPLEEEMATHSSILAWRIPWTEESGAAAAAKSLQLCPTLCDPMDCNPPGSSIHGVFQASVLESVAISFSISTLYILSKCIYVSYNPSIHPIPHSPLGIHIFVPYIYVSISAL